MKKFMMICGCASNAMCTEKNGIKYDEPIPSCAVHDCTVIDNRSFDLSNRMAKCAYYPKGGKYGKCSEPRPSSLDLAFFEYKGPNSEYSMTTCKHCHYHMNAHDKEYVTKYNLNKSTVVEDGRCSGFEMIGPIEYDLYYCGCHGWD